MWVRTIIKFGFILILLTTGHSAIAQRKDNQKQPTRPNIVVILADDLGYETIGSYGGTSYQTPALDRMAAAGMRFNNAYAHPLCTPSRVALMTGRYNFRNYTSFGELDKREKTIANMLRDAGYKTCIAGKWQLSIRDFQAPFHFGFEEYLLWNFGQGDFHFRYWDPRFYLNGNLIGDTKGKFGPDVMGDFVADFINRHKSEPFFVYYPLVLPHDPWIEPPGFQRGNGSEDEERQRKFAAMVAYADKMVGRVNDQLNRLGLSEKTLVIFTSDNGTHPRLVSNLKGKVVRGDKGRPTDAGTHVPLIAKWKGVIPAGTTRDDLIDFTDFLPTLSAITNAMLPSGVVIDGKSFAPQLRGKEGSPREWVFCHYDPKWANYKFSRHAQDKRYKLYHDGSFFDYRHDPLEKSPIAKQAMTSEHLKAREKLQHVLDSLN